MTDSRRILRTVGRFFKNLLLLILMIVVIVAAAGVFIYALYRIAVFSITLYSAAFTIVLAGFLLFFIVRSIKRKRFNKIAVKTIKFFIQAGLILFIIAAVVLYGAFFIRYPVPGLIITPILIVLISFTGIKWKLFSFYRKFYQNL
jgi:hypothetical protein